MLNNVILIGNLTRDVELSYLPSGTAIAKTGIAVNNTYTNKNKEKIDDTCFIDITFFGKVAEVANRYLKKGSKIAITGSLKYDKWTDKEGNVRSKHSITVNSMEMLNSVSEKKETTPTPKTEPETKPKNSKKQEVPKVPEIDIDEDEIPF